MAKKPYKMSKKDAKRYLKLLDRFNELLYADVEKPHPDEHGKLPFVYPMPSITWRTPFQKWWLSEHNRIIMQYFSEYFKCEIGPPKFVGFMPTRQDLEVIPSSL